jgi:hypothetical protein
MNNQSLNGRIQKIHPKTYVRLNSHGSPRFYLKKVIMNCRIIVDERLNLLMDQYKIFIRLLLVKTRMLSSFKNVVTFGEKRN